MKEHERLKLVRKALHQTQLEFSEALEIKQGSYSDVERGKAGISSALIKHLIRKFAVNPIWLVEGQGDMFITSMPESALNGTTVSSTEEGEHDGPEIESMMEQVMLQQKALRALDNIIDFVK